MTTITRIVKGISTEETASPDVERTLALMQQIGVPLLRTPGEWLEDAHVGIRVADKFPSDNEVKVSCACTAPHRYPQTVTCKNGRLIHVVSPCGLKKTRMRQIYRKLADDIQWRYPAIPGAPVMLPHSASEDIDPEGRQLCLPDGTWFSVQERYYRSATTLGNVIAWEAVFFCARPSTTEVVPASHPVFVGLDAHDDVSAFLMPTTRPSHLEPMVLMTAQPANDRQARSVAP